MTDQPDRPASPAGRPNFIGPWRCVGGTSWWRAVRILSYVDAAWVQRSNHREGHLVASIGSVAYVRGPVVHTVK